MSSEVAQAPIEESSIANPISQDLPPNTHLEPAGSSDFYGMLLRKKRACFGMSSETTTG